MYQQLRSNCTGDISKRVNTVIDEAKAANVIDDDTNKGLKIKDANVGNLYFLPKIHKDPNSKTPPGGPICNSRGTPTEKISRWVD